MNTDMILAFSTLIVPLFDVVRVVVHRLREKKNPFLPDQNHFHHKLLRTGMRVRTVMVTILCVSLFFIGFDRFHTKGKDFGNFLIAFIFEYQPENLPALPRQSIDGPDELCIHFFL